jgi:hypothetical protein
VGSGPNHALKRFRLRPREKNRKTPTAHVSERDRMQEENRFWIHVVYENPKDFPGKFVVRRQSPNQDGTILVATNCIVASTLERAREMLAYAFPGLVRMASNDQDDPIIIETWI